MISRTKLTRRTLLAALPLTAAAALAACTTTTDANGNTVVTVNISELDAYARVGVSAVATILSVAAVASALGAPDVAIINAAAAALEAAIAGFDTATSGKLSFTLDDSTPLAAAKSVITALATVLADLKTASSSLSGKIGSNDLANVTTAVSGGETALALIEALLGLVSASASRVLMTRPAMFRAVGLPVPDWA